jgi:hypothetical protein
MQWPGPPKAGAWSPHGPRLLLACLCGGGRRTWGVVSVGWDARRRRGSSAAASSRTTAVLQSYSRTVHVNVWRMASCPQFFPLSCAMVALLAGSLLAAGC